MRQLPPPKPYAPIAAVYLLVLALICLPRMAQADLPPSLQMPPLLPSPTPQAAAPQGQQAAAPQGNGPSLVDKLLDILNNKKLPRIDIPPPAAETPQTAPARPAPSSGPSSGIEIGQSFVPIYSFDKDEADEESPPVLPFFSSAPINEVHKGIQTLVVMLHDDTREAAKAYAYARSAQEEAVARHPEWNADSSFIFAPQFLNSEDIASHAQSWPDKGDALLRWSNTSWATGGNNIVPDNKGIWQPQHGPQHNMSSFTVMDFMLLLLARPKLFPDLQKVVIAGTASGADFVQRYAALGVAPAVLSDEGIDVRFIAGQPRSYMYMDNQRFVPKRDDPISAKIENDSFAPTRPDACKPMNAYPYGFDDLLPYGRKNAVNELRLNYTAKRMIYLVGAGATLPINETTPDACALNAQGNSVRRRAEIFFASLKRLYGDEVDRLQKLYLVQNINEDGLALWRSTCGGAALFGDGACNPDEVGGKAMQIIR